MDKFIILDGNSIAFRAFYGLPLLSNSKGLHTNAIYGMTTMLLKLIEEEKPTHFLVAFDAGKQTFRHKDYAEYKGGRAKTPPELSEQFPVLKQVLQAFSIPQFEIEGYEADDIIGTMSRIADATGKQVLIVSGDKDMLQLATTHVTIAITRKGISELERYNPEQILEKYSLTPDQIIDLKGLMGDTSDNIPGVPGIGEKTAIKLLQAYGSVEEVLAHTHELKGKLKDNLEQFQESAKISKQLATIYREVPMTMQVDELKYNGYDTKALSEVFQQLEFKSLLEKLDLGDPLTIPKKSEVAIDMEVVSAEAIHQYRESMMLATAVHIEAIHDNPHQAEIVGIAFYAKARCYYLSAEVLFSAQAQFVREWLADPKFKKYMFDAHRARIGLAWKGITLRGVTMDCMLTAYLLDPTESALHLYSLANKYSSISMQSDDEVYGKGAKFQIPEAIELAEHICRKAFTIEQLTPILQKELEKNHMQSLFYDLELPLSTVLAEMELTGIRVDTLELANLGNELAVQIEHMIKHIYHLAGEEFNINSPKQLGEILFERLGLPVWKKNKTGYSTDAEVLEKLSPYHEIVGHILHYRQLAKLQSTYVEGLTKEVRAETGKIHTYYKQTIAATGRLSSQYPNLQNIPIRLEEGKKIRKVFTPSRPNWLILSADYSQIELRVLAHIAQDQNLKEAFVQDMDIHTKTAMDVFGVTADKVDSNMRRQAKAVNFGIVYGISDYGLSQNLDIPRKQAAQFIEQYFHVFRGVKKYMEDIVEVARSQGYVTTLLQRRRYLPEITASNFNLRSFAERTAMNTPIQGTAADIIKLAMVQMAKRIEDEGLASKMLLQVHDELVFEVPEAELDRMKQLVPEVMENAIQLDVPLKVDVEVGPTWYDAK